MEMNRLRTGVAGLTGVVCCVLLAVLGPDMPDQAAKTLLKFLLLGLAPVLALLWQGGSLRLGCPRQGRRKRRLLAALAYLIFTGLALTAARFVDLTPINQALAQDGALSIGLFLTAGLLIALPGAFLEEFFFRGFCFQLLAADGVPPVSRSVQRRFVFPLSRGDDEGLVSALADLCRLLGSFCRRAAFLPGLPADGPLRRLAVPYGRQPSLAYRRVDLVLPLRNRRLPRLRSAANRAEF